ncbi:phosphate:acyl-[acyl carrier protein] acyltransferase [Caloramator quimbayensis]|uniref:Phosphate acyltransferase n=1 Tax=Caloramator quimbayensis TaxID=1147123 RepID=A0A1T4XRT0_9CLOT|nr:phosphate acyltransferase PlsX [Caloramator quimbayensis]SKA92257.1 phosphate:acyl-[acyl carrier protein] acyltransferase [Caloramator quimbayensis]
MKIIVDAMGGDNAPLEVVKGSYLAAKEYDIEILLVGDKDKIEDVIKGNNLYSDKIEIVHTTEIITNNDSPTLAIRRKKDSSLVVGMKLLKEKKGDAFISAGSTGAILAGGLFIVGRIEGIDRAALSPVLPGKNNYFMLIDSGANADCKAENILEFGIMGEIYSKKVLKKQTPTIGLVNIGSEEEKGNAFTKECFKVLKESNLNFKGNIEAREIPDGNIDVVLCDGFTGNVILKLFEGVAGTIFDILKEEITSSTISKIGGLILKPVFKRFKKKFDYTEYGGAILLGVDGTVIKAHGSSNSKAIKNAIKQAMLCVNGNIVEDIKNEVRRYKS